MQFKSLSFLFGIILFSLNGCTHKGSVIKAPKLMDIQGQNISFKGKLTVINVWATWCSTCIRELPELNRLQQKYRDNPDIQFIAFADEDLNIVEKALNRWSFNYRHVVDARSFTRSLKSGIVKTYPQNLILNKNCEVVFEHTDGSKDIYKALDDKIQLLKNQ